VPVLPCSRDLGIKVFYCVDTVVVAGSFEVQLAVGVGMGMDRRGQDNRSGASLEQTHQLRLWRPKEPSWRSINVGCHK